MAIFVKPAFVTPKQWAQAALEKAGVSVRLEGIYGVFPPIDVSDNDVSEVLYRDERGRPRTAFLRADGSLSLNVAGW